MRVLLSRRTLEGDGLGKTVSSLASQGQDAHVAASDQCEMQVK